MNNAFKENQMLSSWLDRCIVYDSEVSVICNKWTRFRKCCNLTVTFSVTLKFILLCFFCGTLQTISQVIPALTLICSAHAIIPEITASQPFGSLARMQRKWWPFFHNRSGDSAVFYWYEKGPRTCYPGKKFWIVPFHGLTSFSDRILVRFLD